MQDRQPVAVCYMMQGTHLYNTGCTLWQPRGVCGGGEVEGECKREGTYVYLRLIHVAVWQLPQYCKVIILQLKLKYILKRKSALVRGRYNREESSERYNFFWLWIWTKWAECQGMWGASRRLKKKKRKWILRPASIFCSSKLYDDKFALF